MHPPIASGRPHILPQSDAGAATHGSGRFVAPAGTRAPASQPASAGVTPPYWLSSSGRCRSCLSGGPAHDQTESPGREGVRTVEANSTGPAPIRGGANFGVGPSAWACELVEYPTLSSFSRPAMVWDNDGWAMSRCSAVRLNRSWSTTARKYFNFRYPSRRLYRGWSHSFRHAQSRPN